MKFPKGFLFGSATAAHQIEGGNYDNDWYQWEKIPGNIIDGSTSEVANDSWNNWREDIRLLKQTKQNAYRFSIEWARIEPKEGVFDYEVIKQYKEILLELKKNGIKSMVTLFHFTFPFWLAKNGGIVNKKIGFYFERYAMVVAKELGELIDLWAILNEPNVYLLKGYIHGDWCPGQKNYFKMIKGWFNFIDCQKRAYKKIKKIVKNARIGIAMNIAVYRPATENFLDKIFTWATPKITHEIFLFFIKNYCDFFGINHYMKFIVGFGKSAKQAGENQSDFGWGINPESLYEVIKENIHWGKPIYITENGIADADDKLRPEFIKDALGQIKKALDDNMPVKGYFHWSLMDNFEWAHGYSMKFGLFTIDRKPKKSANIYKCLIEKYSN
jgi:beta-glucosidase